MLCVGGCASDQPTEPAPVPELTPEEAGRVQNSQLQELIDMVPQAQIVGLRGRLPEMSPWSCDTDLGGNRSYWKEDTGTYQLPGGAQIYVADTFDLRRVLGEIAERQAAEGWSVKFLDDFGIAWYLEAPDGYSSHASHIPVNIDGRNEISLQSFSPCFVPVGGLDVFQSYPAPASSPQATSTRICTTERGGDDRCPTAHAPAARSQRWHGASTARLTGWPERPGAGGTPKAR